MKRRTALQLSTLFGGIAAAPWLLDNLLINELNAQSGYSGPYWIFVTANGGWDPRFMFDPTLNPEQNRLYTEIGTVGNINFAPIDATYEDFNLDPETETTNPIVNVENFATRFGARMLVMNGVDTSTNNHDSGQRVFTSGSLQEGMPALGAVLAAQYGKDRPLPFISFGGYDATLGLAPLSRIGSSNVLQDLASPNIIAPEREDSQTYHSPETWSRIRAAQEERLAELQMAQALPKLRRSIDDLVAARITDGDLKALKLPELIDLPGGLGRAENLVRSGQLALASFKAGLGVSANLSIGGFDTHGNHDTDQRRSIVQLLTGLAGILDEIDNQGMTDQVYVLVGSDFGRTPHYNADGNGGGKDHWPITSYLAFGPGIEGDRVIGGTTDGQEARLIDPGTLKAADSGVKLTPQEIHSALRQLAAVDSDLVRDYPVLGSELPLFA